MAVRKRSTARPLQPTVEQSVEIRKIENGFIVRQSGMSGNKYVSKETYHETNPLSKPAVPKSTVKKRNR